MIPRPVLEFVARINAHDADGLAALMAPDHAMIDSLGNRFTRPAIESGWAAYFRMVPDYRVEIERALVEGDTVALFGSAGGTYVPGGGGPEAANAWKAPAAWLATLRGGQVLEWRIYCDNEPIRQRMRAAAG